VSCGSDVFWGLRKSFPDKNAEKSAVFMPKMCRKTTFFDAFDAFLAKSDYF
jgi:hypothetical protein